MAILAPVAVAALCLWQTTEIPRPRTTAVEILQHCPAELLQCSRAPLCLKVGVALDLLGTEGAQR